MPRLLPRILITQKLNILRDIEIFYNNNIINIMDTRDLLILVILLILILALFGLSTYIWPIIIIIIVVWLLSFVLGGNI